MTVNETVIAMLRPKPNTARLTVDPRHDQAAVDGPAGIGTIASYWTEVSLPATGIWNGPSHHDAVVRILRHEPGGAAHAAQVPAHALDEAVRHPSATADGVRPLKGARPGVRPVSGHRRRARGRVRLLGHRGFAAAQAGQCHDEQTEHGPRAERHDRRTRAAAVEEGHGAQQRAARARR